MSFEQTFFDALADATRRRMLLLLLRADERCVCELYQALKQPQPTVSRHLAILREAKLVLVRKEGAWAYYRLHPQLPLWASRVIQLMADASGETLATEKAGTAACCG
ncbi:MAG: metalloregulator ArsR/SmtB family transcription factor [Hydrogenophilales bacterium]|nr:metalloregulator ArsR/SmtB family transcription factor [Hydrogenophilales bacterium]